MNDNKDFSLVKLLAWLADDPLEAGEKYILFQHELIEYIERHGGHTVAEELTDETFNRVDNRLASSLLNEHYNSTEIGDVPNLCRILADEAARNLPSPGRRIWELLSSSDRLFISEIAQAGTFDRNQRSRLSQALNEMLVRGDFYRSEDFNLSAFEPEVKKNSKLENVESALNRGLPQLSESEVEQLNRRLLETSYPQCIKTNLADTPDAEKLPRCKRYARNVLLEYQKEPHKFKTSFTDADESKREDANREAAYTGALDNFINIEDKQEKRHRRACLIECTRLKLSPRDSEIFDLYFTGIIIRSPDDEPLSDREIKEVRKTLAERYGVSPETIRTIVRRCILLLQPCIERCLKRQEKK